jgi:hypothetical protein
MDIRNTCIRCGGRMFLEFDYDIQSYDSICISCGYTEQTGKAKSNPKKGGDGLQGHQPRKVKGFSRN